MKRAGGCGLGALCLFLLSAAMRLPAGELAVTPGGMSPHAALARIRQARQSGDTSIWRVSVASGEYRFETPLILGADDFGITFSGEKGAVFSGGSVLGPWRPDGDGVWSTSVPRDEQGNPIWFEQLFVNGRRTARARFPNRGAFKRQTMTNFCAQAGGGDRWIERCTFTNADLCAALSSASPRQLAAAALCVDVRWCYARRIPRVWDAANGTLETYGQQPIASYFAWDHMANFVLENLPAGFDASGEWFYDVEGERIRYRPLPGEDMRTARVIAPLSKLSRLIVFRGNPDAGRYVRDVRFERIVFAYSDMTESLADTKGGPIEISQYQAAFAHDATVELEGVERVRFELCAFCHTGNHALKFKDGCRHCQVRHCLFDDLGAGGIWIGASKGYVAGNDAPLRRRIIHGLTPRSTAFVDVEDCVIRNGGQINPEATGVVISHASDCRIEHCDIHDFFYSGVSVGWEWGYRGSVSQRNTVAFNRIHDLGKGRMSDMGGVYLLGTSYGTCVSNNVIWNVESHEYGGWGVYTDEGSEGIVVENNLIYDTHDGGFRQHYGADNLIRNNIVAFNRMIGAVRTDRATGMDDVPNTFHFYGNIVYVDGTPLVSAGLRNSWGVFADNLWFDAASHAKPFFDGLDWSGWKRCGKEIGGAYADPLFVDAKKRDFRLRPDSPAFKLGFRPVDPSKAGVHKRHSGLKKEVSR